MCSDQCNHTNALYVSKMIGFWGEGAGYVSYNQPSLAAISKTLEKSLNITKLQENKKIHITSGPLLVLYSIP